MYITFPLQHKINKKSKCLRSLSPPAEERSSERGLEISAPAKTRDEREGEWKSEREREDPCETETGWITWISGGSHARLREWIDRSLESLLAIDRAIGFATREGERETKRPDEMRGKTKRPDEGEGKEGTDFKNSPPSLSVVRRA